MTCSPRTVAALLARLPDPRRATLADLAHAEAMRTRGRLGAPAGQLAERLADLDAWRHAATTATNGAHR